MSQKAEFIGECQRGEVRFAAIPPTLFCARCGSTLFYMSSLSPGEVHIALANMTGNIDRPPELHVVFDARVDWFQFGDDLVRLDKDSELLAHYKQVEV